jgi:hypothetical protein
MVHCRARLEEQDNVKACLETVKRFGIPKLLQIYCCSNEANGHYGPPALGCYYVDIRYQRDEQFFTTTRESSLNCYARAWTFLEQTGGYTLDIFLEYAGG